MKPGGQGKNVQKKGEKRKTKKKQGA